MKKLLLITTFLLVFIAGASAQNKLSWRCNGMKCTAHLDSGRFSITMFDDDHNEYTFFVPDYEFDVDASSAGPIYYENGKITILGGTNINYVGEKVTLIGDTSIRYSEGKVATIGETKIHYYGSKVTTIGEISIRYTNGKITSVGKATVHYSNGKASYISGSVK